MLTKIKLDQDFGIFLDADYTAHSGSCISHQTHELKDVHEKYGGFPSTFTPHNTEIRQLWYDDTQLDFKKLGTELGIDVVTVSSILQPPGNIVPIHRDTFFQINKHYPTDARQKVRANIYLKDWREGQFIHYEVNDKWYNSTHWVAGDGFLWDSDHLHVSGNAGFTDKYTLQVSGFMK
jgi:hypothetical protein|tara:strand:- start:5233 stop:5766 length:534 start_codon:yes stop_codon:yes gene_type:complete